MEDDPLDGSNTAFTDAVRGHCPECGGYVEIPIVINTDGHYADVEVIPNDESPEEGF